MSADKVYDKTYAEALFVTPMTVGRWRRGLVVPNIRTVMLAKALHTSGMLPHLPDWLVNNGTPKKD